MPNAIPESVLNAVTKLESFEYDISGITFAKPNELNDAQRGYQDLPPGLFVIGHESGLGDPIGLDTRDPRLPAWTAMHGEGEWNPVQIADSLNGLIDAVAIMKRLSAGRECPVAVESSPLPRAECDAGLAAITNANPESNIEFWAVMLGVE